MSKRFLVLYEEERPGWDEFGGSRIGDDIIVAESIEEAKYIFETDKTRFKYCFLDKIFEQKH